jgi:LPPG:FO 2-phospho-L-lactate transferase
VQRGGRDDVKGVRFQGLDAARPAQGVLEALAEADAIVFAPSNPVVSIGPILGVPGIREAIEARRDVTVGVSGIIGGAPLAGMADRLMPASGLEVTAAGAASAYRGLLQGWLIDERDRELAPRIERDLGIRVAITDTIMVDDDDAEAVARATLRLLET